MTHAAIAPRGALAITSPIACEVLCIAAQGAAVRSGRTFTHTTVAATLYTMSSAIHNTLPRTAVRREITSLSTRAKRSGNESTMSATIALGGDAGLSFDSPSISAISPSVAGKSAIAANSEYSTPKPMSSGRFPTTLVTKYIQPSGQTTALIIMETTLTTTGIGAPETTAVSAITSCNPAGSVRGLSDVLHRIQMEHIVECLQNSLDRPIALIRVRPMSAAPPSRPVANCHPKKGGRQRPPLIGELVHWQASLPFTFRAHDACATRENTSAMTAATPAAAQKSCSPGPASAEHAQTANPPKPQNDRFLARSRLRGPAKKYGQVFDPSLEIGIPFKAPRRESQPSDFTPENRSCSAPSFG
ncbi:hypothetical protein FQR65_LT19500 [Abscondita terminalis]|nr:hypothetical protein FQR65_LT19500 [Abscondita terminalis]